MEQKTKEKVAAIRKIMSDAKAALIEVIKPYAGKQFFRIPLGDYTIYGLLIKDGVLMATYSERYDKEQYTDGIDFLSIESLAALATELTLNPYIQ